MDILFVLIKGGYESHWVQIFVNLSLIWIKNDLIQVYKAKIKGGLNKKLFDLVWLEFIVQINCSNS